MRHPSIAYPNSVVVESGSRALPLSLSYIHFSSVRTLVGHRDGVLSLVAAQSPELGLYSGSRDKTIRAWDLMSLSCRQTLKVYIEVVDTMIFLESSHGK